MQSWYPMILAILFRMALLAVGQSYDCHSASEATLNDIEKCNHRIHGDVMKNTNQSIIRYVTEKKWLFIQCVMFCMLEESLAEFCSKFYSVTTFEM